MNLVLLNFIKNHQDWKELLQQPPYNLSIKEDGGYVILKYNQINSDFSQPLVKEARGIILDAATLVPVCVPFFKFFNYGEQYAADLDWDSAQITEKIDGSLIKLWWDKGTWHWSTNGTIDAAKAEVKQSVFVTEPNLTFLKLIQEADNYNQIDYSSLSVDYTYMFELVSPKNQIVLPYAETSLYYLGARDNYTFEEVKLDIGIKKPRSFDFSTLDQCIAATQSNLFKDKEGMVAKDKYGNRVKIKTEDYFLKHKLANNGEVNGGALLQLIKINDYEELLSYFPQYKPVVDDMIDAINTLSYYMQEECAVALVKKADGWTRAAIAQYMTANNYRFKDYIFKSLYGNQFITPISYLFSMPENKLLDLVQRQIRQNKEIPFEIFKN